MKINNNFLNLKDSYLFSKIASKVNEYQENNPSKKLLKLGIGDVTIPLQKEIVDSMEKAVKEMGVKETFHGYGPEQGYLFLRNKIKEYYKRLNVDLKEDEIFISDGAKSDCGNILDILDVDNKVLIPDPVYPVYVDTNIMAGREITFIDANEDNNFLPLPDENLKMDIIYICSPNNPTGAAYNKEQLKKWVDYANKYESVILFDSAYEAFIEEDDIPHSIFEIEGAKSCAIEICSLSKTAGFTGTRCGYTIISHELKSNGVELNRLWFRRQSTKFNGVSYPVQVAAEAVFSEEGNKQIKEAIKYYKDNAKIISNAMDELDIWYTGGKNSPYIWFKCPNKIDSWSFFDILLEKANVIGTPGEGFGKNGEGFFRLSSFGERQTIEEAVNRIKELKF